MAKEKIESLKDVKEEEQEHLTYGKNVHKAAEEYSKNQTPIPREYGFIQPYVQKLLDAKEKHFVKKQRENKIKEKLKKDGLVISKYGK